MVEPADLEVSPLEAKMASLQKLGLQGSSGDLRRRAETPKWEAEIDKVAGRIEPLPERRPRRASTSGGTPIGHLQRDFVRSPSAQQRSAQEEWRLRQQQQHRPSQHMWDGRRPVSEQRHFVPNGYVQTGVGIPDGSRREREDVSGSGGSGWTTPTAAAHHTMPARMQQRSQPTTIATGRRGADDDFNSLMSASMPSPATERPTVREGG